MHKILIMKLYFFGCIIQRVWCIDLLYFNFILSATVYGVKVTGFCRKVKCFISVSSKYRNAKVMDLRFSQLIWGICVAKLAEIRSNILIMTGVCNSVNRLLFLCRIMISPCLVSECNEWRPVWQKCFDNFHCACFTLRT